MHIVHVPRPEGVARGVVEGTDLVEGSSMSKPIPTIRRFMTTSLHSVGRAQTLATAHDMMRTHHVRHLPVLEGGKLVGLVTIRDLHLVETFRDVDATKVTVEEAMTSDVYAVSPEAPLDEVAAEMAERKYGCTIVMQNEHVVGVFTTVDACRALHDLLHDRLAK